MNSIELYRHILYTLVQYANGSEQLREAINEEYLRVRAAYPLQRLVTLANPERFGPFF